MSPGDAVLRTAAADLRGHVDQRWVEIADALVSRALTASRPSPPLPARATSGPVHVSQQVVVGYLRDAVDAVDDCEVVTIRVDSDGDVCTGVVIALAVRYGTPLIPLADRVRERAEGRLQELLGPVAPPVTVAHLHVHVVDVTRGDPKL